MYRRLCATLALLAAIGLHSQAARADGLLDALFGHQDPRLVATGIGLGLAADGAAYALYHPRGVPATRIASAGVAYGVTSFGCAVVYPIIGTIVVQRELTPREAYMGIASCVVPIVGGLVVDSLLPHTAWYDGVMYRNPIRRHHHHG